MKKNFLTLSLFLFSILTYAQSWEPVGDGVNGQVNTLFVFDSVMYIGGHFSSPGNNIAQWNGSAWDSLGSGINNQVNAFGIYKGLVYVGGLFTEAGGHSAGSIATWNGTIFANAGFDVEGGKYDDGRVDAICAYDSLLYIGGGFDSVNHKYLAGLATWDRNKVDSAEFSWRSVSILTTYKNQLYFGFASGYGGGLPVITWNNMVSNYLGYDFFSPTPTSNELYMNAFCSVDNNLYMGGNFIYYEHNGIPPKEKVNNIAMWNGTAWTALGKGIHGTVNALVSYHNMLIAGGSFDSAGDVPVNNIAAWNGTSWSALGNGVNGTVYTLAVFDSVLYAGGSFSSPGNGIVKYAALPKTTPISDSVNVFPNPTNGQFTVICNTAIIKSSVVTFEVYNTLGEKIYSSVLVSENTTIDLGKQAAGVHLYRVSNSEGNLISPGKLVIE